MDGELAEYDCYLPEELQYYDLYYVGELPYLNYFSDSIYCGGAPAEYSDQIEGYTNGPLWCCNIDDDF